MHRPQCLRQTVQLNLLERFLAGMTRRKTAVIRRMPILCRDYDQECRLQFIRDRNHRVPIRHGERAAGQEIVLNINEYQCLDNSWKESALPKELHDFACPQAIGFLHFFLQFIVSHPRPLPLVPCSIRNIAGDSLRPVHPLLVLNLVERFEQSVRGLSCGVFTVSHSRGRKRR